MANATPMTRQELEQQVLSRAWKDQDFRQELKTNPHEAIKRELGVTIPAEMHVFVHEEASPTLHLFFNVNPAQRLVTELSDEELERVAGGLDESTPGLARASGVRG